MKYNIVYTSKFKRSLRLCQKRGFDTNLIFNVIKSLEENGKVDMKYRPHKLTGNYENCWECHIKPGWLLIWEQDDTVLRLLLVDTGTHSDLF